MPSPPIAPREAPRPGSGVSVAEEDPGEEPRPPKRIAPQDVAADVPHEHVRPKLPPRPKMPKGEIGRREREVPLGALYVPVPPTPPRRGHQVGQAGEGVKDDLPAGLV